MRSRRGFLGTVFGPTFAAASVIDQALLRATLARAQPAGPAALFDLRRIAPGVWAAVAKPETLLNSNAVIFENSRDLLIMDSHSKPSAVAALVRQLRREVTEKPVRYVVASHFHWDHSQGLPAYRRVFPNASVLATETTRRLIDTETVPRLKASFETLRAQLDGYKQKAAAAKSPEEKAAYESMRRQTDDYLREMADFKPELPDVTITRDLVLHDKEHDLHLAFRGRAHTAGDVVVYCPQKKVVATGDLLHGFFPFIGDGYPADWPNTLLQVAGFEFDQIAGGHGPVHGRQRLYQMANYIEEVTEAVVRGKRAGKSQARLEAEITPDTLKTVNDGDYGSTTVASILSLRMLPPPKPSAAAVLADSVRTNVGHIYTALDKS